jgi:hypothetical protein
MGREEPALKVGAIMKDWLLYLGAFAVFFIIWQLFWRTTFFLMDWRSLPLFIVAAMICWMVIRKIRKSG